VPAGMRHFTNLTGTQPAAEAPRGPALPFGRVDPAAAAASESVVPAGMRRFTSLTGTQIAPAAARGPALPFVQPGQPAAAPETLAPIVSAPPAPASAEPPVPLAQYVRLHVELALEPANRHQILDHHGLDERRLGQLDAFWSPRIKVDPGLRAAWDSAYAAHRAWLLSSKRPQR